MNDKRRYDNLLARVEAVKEMVNREGLRPLGNDKSIDYCAGYGGGLVFALDLLEQVMIIESRESS